MLWVSDTIKTLTLDGSPALVLTPSSVVTKDCSESELLSLELLVSCLACDLLALLKGFSLWWANVPPCVPNEIIWNVNKLHKDQSIKINKIFIDPERKYPRTLMTIANERSCIISIRIALIGHNLFIRCENFPLADRTNSSIFCQPRVNTFWMISWNWTYVNNNNFYVFEMILRNLLTKLFNEICSFW